MKRVGICVLITLSTACSARDEERALGDDSLVIQNEPAEVAPRVPSNWLGYAIGAKAGRWTKAGEMKRSPVKSREFRLNLERRTNAVTSPELQPEQEAVGTTSTAGTTLGIIDLQSEAIYSVEMAGDDLAKISAAVAGPPGQTDSAPPSEGDDATNGVQGTSEFSVTADSPLVEKAWSGGVDNRIARGIGDNGYTKTTQPYKWIGATGSCTGTMITCKDNNNTCFFLTAAHCILDENGWYIDQSFSPRRDDNLDCGSECSGVNPYGTWLDDGSAVIDRQFITRQCYKESKYDWPCVSMDIAVVRVKRCSTCTAPGWIGRGLYSQSTLGDYTKSTRGYPSCNSGIPDRPANCKSNTLYGDGALSVGTFEDPDADGWNRRFFHSADVSPGQSGSALYIYKDSTYYLFAILVGDTGCGKNCGARPSIARRFTPQWANIVNTYISGS